MTATTVEGALPHGLERKVAERFDRARAEDVVERIRRHDGTLWAPPGTPEVVDRLGWVDIADRMAARIDELTGFVEEVCTSGCTDAVLLGMGGSSLAPEVFWRSFGYREGYLRLHVLDCYGPRLLHSTGQLHKGGAPTGVFVQLREEPTSDLDVPGKPYTLATLFRAQADGDLQTLRAHGLDVVRTTLDDLENELS